jgi:outer membrane protein
MIYLKVIQRLILLNIILLGAVPLVSQQTLTLNETLRIALERNPDIQFAEKSILQAEYTLSTARSNALPSLSFIGNYQRSWELPEFVFSPPAGFPGANGEIRVRTGVENTITGGLVFQQPIYTGGAVSAGIGIASDAVKISQQSYYSIEQQTIQNVYSAFYGVLLTQSLMDVAETAVENALVNFNQVERRYEQGAASRFELLRAEVQLATIKPALTESRHRYEVAIEHLKDLLGMDKRADILVSGSFQPRAKTLLDADIEDLVDRAYMYRPEYQMQRLQQDINRKNIRAARSEFLPRVVFSSALQWQALRDDLNIGYDDFIRFSNSEISVQIPLFNGFGSRARFQEARAELQKSEIQEKNIRNLIATEIRAIYNELTQTYEILQSQERVMAQAGEGLRLANLLYEEGAATLLEVIDAQLAVTQASTNYFQSIYNFNTASIKLERAIGILEITSIIEGYE